MEALFVALSNLLLCALVSAIKKVSFFFYSIRRLPLKFVEQFKFPNIFV